MRYLGGKSKLAKPISEVILSRVDDRAVYREPFLGGGAMAAKMAHHFDEVHLSDVHPDLMMMWQAVLLDGWTPPETLSEGEWRELRDAEPSALRGFAGFGGSFGGKWFGGYARGGLTAAGLPRDHQAESRRTVLRVAQAARGKASTHVTRAGYLDVRPGPGEVVYCDPPYADTTGYAGTDGFDHAEFWDAATHWAVSGAHVFVSEYTAPPWWGCVWGKEHRATVSRGDGEHRRSTTERLFTLDI